MVRPATRLMATRTSPSEEQPLARPHQLPYFRQGFAEVRLFLRLVQAAARALRPCGRAFRAHAHAQSPAAHRAHDYVLAVHCVLR